MGACSACNKKSQTLKEEESRNLSRKRLIDSKKNVHSKKKVDSKSKMDSKTRKEKQLELFLAHFYKEITTIPDAAPFIIREQLLVSGYIRLILMVYETINVPAEIYQIIYRYQESEHWQMPQRKGTDKLTIHNMNVLDYGNPNIISTGRSTYVMRYCNVYGSLSHISTSNLIHNWNIKILAHSGRYEYIYLGIIQANHINGHDDTEPFTKTGFGYALSGNGWIHSLGDIKGMDRDDRYNMGKPGHGFGRGCDVLMSLNLNESILSFKVKLWSDENVVEIKNIKKDKDIRYRLAVFIQSAGDNTKIELVSYDVNTAKHEE
eukprot:202574_1